MPDFDLLDEGTGFEKVNVPKAERELHRAIEYSIGDRSQSSDYIQNKLRAAGFDVKAQAKLMGFFYERGHF